MMNADKLKNVLIAESLLLRNLEDLGFEVEEGECDERPTIIHPDSCVRVWADFDSNEPVYECILDLSDLEEHYPEEYQQIMCSVEEIEPAEEEGSVLLRSTRMVDIKSAVRTFFTIGF